MKSAPHSIEAIEARITALPPEPWDVDLRLLLAVAKAARSFLSPGGARYRGRLAAALNALDNPEDR